MTSSYVFVLPMATAPIPLNTIMFRASTSTICLKVMVEAPNTMALGTVSTGNMKA